jgi:hypothetical protein
LPVTPRGVACGRSRVVAARLAPVSLPSRQGPLRGGVSRRVAPVTDVGCGEPSTRPVLFGPFHPASRPSGAPPWGRSPPATRTSFTGGPSVTQAEPSWSVGSSFQGSWSPSRRHPGERHVLWTVTSTAAPPPGFLTLSAVSSQTRASRPSAPRLRGALHAAAVQDLPLQGSTRRNRASLPGPLAPSSFGVRRVRVRSLTALRPSICRPHGRSRALISLDFP